MVRAGDGRFPTGASPCGGTPRRRESLRPPRPATAPGTGCRPAEEAAAGSDRPPPAPAAARAHPRAASRLLMSFLIFQISTFLSAALGSSAIFSLRLLLPAAAAAARAPGHRAQRLVAAPARVPHPRPPVRPPAHPARPPARRSPQAWAPRRRRRRLLPARRRGNKGRAAAALTSETGFSPPLGAACVAICSHGAYDITSEGHQGGGGAG